MSVGDPAAKRQLDSFGPKMSYVDSRGEQNEQLHVGCAQDGQRWQCCMGSKLMQRTGRTKA